MAEKEGVLKRLEVRYSTANKDGAVSVRLRSVWSNKQGVHQKTREVGDFDTLTVYCPQTDKVYFINSEDFSNTSELRFRINEPKQQQQSVRLAKDYEWMVA